MELFTMQNKYIQHLITFRYKDSNICTETGKRHLRKLYGFQKNRKIFDIIYLKFPAYLRTCNVKLSFTEIIILFINFIYLFIYF